MISHIVWERRITEDYNGRPFVWAYWVGFGFKSKQYAVSAQDMVWKGFTSQPIEFAQLGGSAGNDKCPFDFEVSICILQNQQK